MFESHEWKFYKLLLTFLKGHNFCRIRLVVVSRAGYIKPATPLHALTVLYRASWFFLCVTSCGSMIGKH